ncbi:hypothetical protein, partial [Aquimarina sp. MMG016]|uniref:hypothetical protein n=1 Tax=Aquimarina sp. MMG016 TaxID=2822690 RepID=UPI001B3A468E
SYTAKFWQYDSRIGRRWNIDPKYMASESRYAAFSNNPNIYVDPLGDFRTKFGAKLYKWTHGGEVIKDKNSGEWFVGKDDVYKGEGVGGAYQRRFDWQGRNRPYKDSGWGHTERSFIANKFDVNGEANNLFDLGWNSILQNDSVKLTGDLLNRVKQDPSVKALEEEIINCAQEDGRCGEMDFSFLHNKFVQLGGRRGSLNPLEKSSIDTWRVAINPLTWAVRSTNIEANVQVTTEGIINITYQFSDSFDLRPEKGGKIYFGGTGNSPFSKEGGTRPWQYNAATTILGIPYHDILGGNDKLKINGTWSSENNR